MNGACRWRTMGAALTLMMPITMRYASLISASGRRWQAPATCVLPHMAV